MNFYKGRYLIAIYDKEDRLIDVASTMKELRVVNKETAHSYLSYHKNNKSNKHKYYLIDVFEKHNDIFEEEDKLFLEMFDKPHITLKEIALQLGITERTLYRKYTKKQRDELKMSGGISVC